jgi:hypothetical protein
MILGTPGETLRRSLVLTYGEVVNLLETKWRASGELSAENI